MRKVKIMLFTFVLLTIVGGALAFKAKYNQNFCTTTQYIAGLKTTCPLLLQNVTSTNGLGGITFYTTPAPNLDCTYFDEIEGVNKAITCLTWTKTKGD